MRPFFSVIVPTYNRATLVGRAIDSVLRQAFADFEIVVVDSASTDDTREIVRRYASADARVRLVCEETRRGVCPARNTAIDASHGVWIVPLDSDDELTPDALSIFRQKIDAAPEVAQHRFMCRLDDGSLSPSPPLVEEQWDYEKYLRFLDRTMPTGTSETMSCMLASTFEHARYAEDRAYEIEYHLAFALRYRTATHPEVARLYHMDAVDQNSFVPNPTHWLRVAPDFAPSLARIVKAHGEAMKRVAPSFYDEILYTAAKYYFMAGNRVEGISRMLKFWSRKRNASSLVIFGFGMLGPRPLAWAQGVRGRLRPR